MAPSFNPALAVSISRSALAYRLVFDVGRDSASPWMGMLPGSCFVLGGALIFLVFRRSTSGQARAFAVIAGTLAALAGGVFGFQAVQESRDSLASRRDALQFRRYQNVEGEVRDFTFQGPGSHPHESWSVAGHRYTMWRIVWASEFSTPGVVKPGMRVRIADVDGAIVRLDVAE
jgi:hypothetical protein